MTTSGSQTEAYADTNQTVIAQVTPRTVTQSDQIARYFTDDLKNFVRETNINLVEELDIPSEHNLSSSEAIEMLYEDLAHMLREGIITGIHLLLSEPQRDPNSGAFPLRYHAMYVVNSNTRTPQRSLSSSSVQQRGGSLALPTNVWLDARFALLIDWNPSANERRRLVRRPEYCFDWVPKQAKYDATTLIRYREGTMTVNSATVVERRELRSPGF